MSKLDDILNADEYWDEGHGDVSVFQPDLAKPAIKDLIIQLAETHASDDQNINLASFVAEVNNL